MKARPACFSLLAVVGVLFSSIVCGQSPQLIAPTDPLPPEQQRERFHLPAGFEIQLIVSEETIGQPMNLNFDAAGRLWITSSVTYPYPVDGEGVEPREERFGPADPGPARDWVTVVEGIRADGTPDRVRKFVSGLNIPIGVVPVKDGTIVFDIPAITLRRDTDGDGQADSAKRLLWGFGNLDTHGMNNGFTRWIDGWIYACHGFRNTSHVKAIDGRTLTMNSGNTYRFREDGTELEQFTWGQVNPYGLTFDPLGNLYSADCHSLPLTLLLRGAYYSSFGKPHDGLGFGPDMIDHLHGSTGICGPAYYAADQFPEAYRDQLYLCNPVTGRVHRDRLIDHGSTRLVDSQPDFITCDDPWFRPVDVQVGPDGCLYVADFYNAIIGHYEVELKHPRRDRQLGRVWRVVYRGEDGSIDPPSLPDLTVLSLDDLVAELGSANLVVRMLATNELIDRFGSDAGPALIRALSGPTSPEQRVHGMWVLHRLDLLKREQLTRLARDDNRLVRTHVARLLAETPNWPADPDLVAMVESLANDDDAFVQRAAVDALGRQVRQETIPLLLGLLAEVPEGDTHLRHTIRIALRNQLRGESIDYSDLLGSKTEDLRELMSVSLAVHSEAVAGFLSAALDRSDEAPQRLLEYAQHIARNGTEEHLEQTVRAWKDRFGEDTVRNHQLLLILREGLGRRGTSPSPFLTEEAAALARKLLDSPEDSAVAWSDFSIEGVTTTEPAWVAEDRSCEDGASATFFSTWPRGERATGIHRSAGFVLPGQLSFYLAGHCGPPETAGNGKNRVRLVDAETGVELASAVAPRHDVARQIVWDLAPHAGRTGYLELIDGDSAGSYAWMAVGRFSIDGLNPASFSSDEAAEELVARYQLASMRTDLFDLLTDDTCGLSRRLAAARALLSLDPDARLQVLVPYASDPRVGSALRTDILSCVETRDAAQIEAVLAAVMQSLPASQQEVFALSLASDRDGGELLMNLVENGKASRRLLLNDALKQQLAGARVSSWEERLGELTRGLPSLDDQIAQRINQHRKSFDLQSASADKGKLVFEKVCAACHRIGDRGAVIGPQLDGVGVRGIDRLLEDLLDPNRNVDGAFRITTILTNDGKVLTGLFRRQEGETLVFADQKGKEFTVESGEIEEQTISAVSLMPTNLYETVQPDQVNHLIAFLLEQRTAAATPSE